MPKTTSRTWEVLNGPDSNEIALAVLMPDRSVCYTLGVKASNSDETFRITVEVDDIWTGTSKRYGTTKRRPWNGSLGFSGTTFCSQLTYDLAAQARVSVTYEIGKKVGELTVVSID